ncbi:MAG: DNA polymerase III subunit chi [Holosporales bacterium]|jgi:DNA polymerase IIIc chi subunit|nr:DNA polymerase III subunit chi [Holosporales bacterium]
MQERRVIFYAIESDFLSIATKFIEKMYTVDERVLLLCSTDDEVRQSDLALWTFSRISFIPHGSQYSTRIEDAEFCHTWISTLVDFYNDPVCLVHNGLNVLQDRSVIKFNSIIDIFDKGLLPTARKRAEAYRELQFLQQKLWLQKSEGGWDSGDW